MQIIKDMATDQGQADFKSAITAETAKICAEIHVDKKRHGGLSKTQRTAPKPWQYQNSNFGVGI